MATYPNETGKQAGFTLIEVLLVITLIGIASAISYPSVSSYMAKYNFRAASREVLTTAMQARSNAIRDNKNWRVNITPPGIFTLEAEVIPKTSPKTYTVIQTHNLSSYGNGILLIASGLGKTCGNATGLTQATAIGFSGRGFGDPIGSIYLENSNQRVCFEVSASTNGVAKIRYFNGSAWK